MLIAPDGTAKLTDFGVSVIMTNNADTIQQVGPNDTCAALSPPLLACKTRRCLQVAYCAFPTACLSLSVGVSLSVFGLHERYEVLEAGDAHPVGGMGAGTRTRCGMRRQRCWKGSPSTTARTCTPTACYCTRSSPATCAPAQTTQAQISSVAPGWQHVLSDASCQSEENQYCPLACRWHSITSSDKRHCPAAGALGADVSTADKGPGVSTEATANAGGGKARHARPHSGQCLLTLLRSQAWCSCHARRSIAVSQHTCHGQRTSRTAIDMCTRLYSRMSPRFPVATR